MKLGIRLVQLRIQPSIVDPLWDGEGCSSNSMCCQFNDPPWFQTELPQATRDGVELRLCLDTSIDEDIIINLIEIYVK